MSMAGSFLDTIVALAILLFEYMGVGVIIFAGVQGIINCPPRPADPPQAG